jgi:hypothetical protein
VKECFIPRNFKDEAATTIEQMNSIFEEYQRQGFVITLRQLFYQFVSRGLRPNTMKTYTYLGYVLRNARLAGLVDWDLVEDRTRETQRWMAWADPAERIRTAAEQYFEDPWADHDVRLYVWIEKAALVNIVEPACEEWSVPYFAVRGYNSVSEMYAMGKEFGELVDDDIRPVVLYLGSLEFSRYELDHDPSGINMPQVAQRDLAMFADAGVEVRRLALNMDQVRRYSLPPNYAKETDKRYDAYVEEFGTEECWELDALEPTVIDQLLREEIASFVDMRKWREAKEKERANRNVLSRVAENWESVVELLQRQ